MDAKEREKIYVAVGDDTQDGFNTLNWALKKWNSHSISIVILHVTHNISKDYVYTPFGKLPARSLNDEKLEALRKDEKERIKKLFSKYIAFCGKVPTEIHEVEKLDEPKQKHIIDLIMDLGITKLVMGFSFMKPSLKSKGAISGLFYVHQHKPTFCELFIICVGKQVFLRGNNDEKIMEDDSGVMVAKMRDKVTFKDWLDKIFSDKTNDYSQNSLSASPSTTNLGQNQWEFYLQDIENYYQELLSSNLEEGSYDNLHISPTIEPRVTQQNNSNMNTAEKIEILNNKVNEARKTIQLKRKEVKDNIERSTKAEWAISLCNIRAEEIEGRIREELRTKEELNKELNLEKEQREETRREIEEKKQRLHSLLEVQSELSNKLQISTVTKSRSEAQLKRAVKERTEMVREIEELRKQRNVLNRRIEFCKQKDAIGMAARLGEDIMSCGMREYSEEELRLATDNFSERLRLLKCGGGDCSNVYRGRFNHSTVAIQMVSCFASLSQQDFQAKVRLLGGIRQPHLVAMVGFCFEPKCIVLEYMSNGSLRDMLFSRRRNRALRWHDRIRIAAEVCSGLGFLNSNAQRPNIHCHLNLANVLLDRNLVAKITGFGLQECDDKECNVESDLRDVGILLMQLLTGRNWVGPGPGPVEEALTMDMDRENLVNILDDMAGQWPLDLAKEIAGLAMICMSMKNKPNLDLTVARVLEELNIIRRKGDEIVAKECRNGGCIDRGGSSDVPSVFLCPILQEVMKNPHVAADGFSYELEAIEQWLNSGHNTSPMTNLRLSHTFLTPNHTLRSFLDEWQINKSAKIAN